MKVANFERPEAGNDSVGVMDGEPQDESSENRDSEASQRSARSQENDPFGIRMAAEKAREPKSMTNAAGAKLVNVSLLAIGLTPLVLLVLLPILAVLEIGRPVTTVLAIVFWIWAIAFAVFQLRLFRTGSNPMLPRKEKPGKRGSVIVIGAGPVGLAVVKECLALGLEVQCFDRKTGVGGIYRYDPEQPGGVWKGARLTSSPWVTAFSDFPPPNASSVQYKHDEYLAYLENYADRFQLTPSIHFSHTVEMVQPEGDGWQVTVRDDEKGEVRTVTCDRVAVCSGLNQIPRATTLPGMADFKGEVRHVVNYKGPEGFEGKRVLVVGLGESGTDIAYEMSGIAEKTMLSISKGKFIIPRINPLTGRANDYDTNRVRNAAPLYLKDWVMTFKRSLCGSMKVHTPESAARARLLEVSRIGPNSQVATKSDDFIKPLIEGKLAIRPQVKGFDGHDVLFDDGTREAFDTIILAHGYHPVFPFLKLPEGVMEKHPGHLYLRMFYPDIGDSLAFCGFTRPAIGAIPPTGELQARLFALVAAGKRTLPAMAAMQKSMAIDRMEDKKRFPLLPEAHAIISWIPYMDKIAALVDCRPKPWKLLSSPYMLWKVATGPVNAAHYRLHGTGAVPIAKKTVRSLPTSHKLDELVTMLGLHFWVWPFGFLRSNRRLRSDITCV